MAEKKTEERHEPLTWLRLADDFHTLLKETLGEPMPGEFWHHLRAAHKETLLAARALIDARINQIEERQARAAGRTATKITVK